MADIVGIEEALTLFRTQHGRLPTSEEGLAALVPDYLDRLPIDPWGHAYLYDIHGETPRIISYSSDGKLGGEGPATDITSEHIDPHRHDDNASRQPIASRRPNISDATATELFLASVLLIPFVAYFATDRPLWAVGVLAGAAGLFSVIAFTLCGFDLLFGGSHASLLPPLGIGVFFALAAAGVLLRVRYSDGAVMVALACLAVLFWTISGQIRT